MIFSGVNALWNIENILKKSQILSMCVNTALHLEILNTIVDIPTVKNIKLFQEKYAAVLRYLWFNDNFHSYEERKILNKCYSIRNVLGCSLISTTKPNKSAD